MAKKKKGNKPGIRRIGRALAFQVLYGTQFTDKKNPVDIVTSFDQNPLVLEQSSETARDFAYALVMGVDASLEAVNSVIEEHSQHWKIKRIGIVELAILRLSIYEMIYTEMPLRAGINEAVELSKTFGDDKSRGFINGILDGVAKSVASGKFEIKKSF